MSANLALSDKNHPMFASLREMPWHGQGTVIQDEVSGKEMLKIAHLDWDVLSTPAVYMSQTVLKNHPIGWDDVLDKPVLGNKSVDNGLKHVPGKKVVFRSDTGESLGIVGNDFEVLQNFEMVDFFEGLVQGNKIIYETAGGLGNGDIVWILARIPDLTIDVKGDQSVPYMLIQNGHSGKSSLQCFPTTVRVVCANTIRAASAEYLSNKKKHGKNNVHAGYTIRHRKNMRNVIADVQKSYESCIRDFKSTEELFLALANKNFTSAEKDKFFEFIADPKGNNSEDEVSKAKETKKANKIDILEMLLESPTNQVAGTKGTLYSLLNVGTEYVDHERATRCTDDKDEAYCKFESAMFGTGDDLKTDILSELKAMV